MVELKLEAVEETEDDDEIDPVTETVLGLAGLLLELVALEDGLGL